MKKQLKSLHEFKRANKNAGITKTSQTFIYGGRTDTRTSGASYDKYGREFDTIHRIDGEIYNVTYPDTSL